MNELPALSYSDRMDRVIVLAMEEILGHAEAEALLPLALPPVHPGQPPGNDMDAEFTRPCLSRLQAAFETVYGIHAGRGLLLRVGRACIKYCLREFGSELGLTDLAFRLLPLPTRIRTGSEKLAGLFNRISEESIQLEVDERYTTWNFLRCPLCRERHADSPCCVLAVGLLQEGLFWVSGGRNYLVEETKCIACGDSACTIVVDRTPMS